MPQLNKSGYPPSVYSHPLARRAPKGAQLSRLILDQIARDPSSLPFSLLWLLLLFLHHFLLQSGCFCFSHSLKYKSCQGFVCTGPCQGQYSTSAPCPFSIWLRFPYMPDLFCWRQLWNIKEGTSEVSWNNLRAGHKSSDTIQKDGNEKQTYLEFPNCTDST